MNKEMKLWIILDSIFLIIFNAIFFVLGGTEHNAAVWISYVFIHFAYIMLIFTPFLISSGKSKVVFGFSLYSISSYYFFAELVIGVIFIVRASENYRAALLIQLCIAGLYGISLLSNMIANERTAKSEEKRQPQIEYVKNAAAKVKNLLEIVNDKEVKKQIEKVYDAIYSSPVKSHPNLAQTESQILMYINELSDAVSVGNKDNILTLADTLLITVNERNRQLKLFN
jgi:hypothetical protein